MFSFRLVCSAVTRKINTNQISCTARFIENKHYVTQKKVNLARKALVCAKRNQPDEALAHIKVLSSKNTRLTTDLCENVITSLVKNQGLDKATASIATVVQLFGKQNYINRHSRLPYFILEIAIENDQTLETALQIHNLLTPYNIPPTPEASEALLKLYKHTRDAPSLWSEVSTKLTPQSFYLLYRALFCQRGTVDVFCDTALLLLKDMKQLGHKPSHNLYSRVLSRLKRMRVSDREAEWKEAFEPLLTDTDTPASHMTSQALEAVYEGRFDEATMLIHRVIAQNHVPNTSAVTSIMEHALQNRRYDTVLKVYNAVMVSVSKLSNSQRAHAIKMIGSMALISYARQNHGRGALVCYRHMASHHVYPTSEAYGALVNILPEKDVQVVYEEVKPYHKQMGPYFFNCVISRFAKQKLHKQAIRVYQDMKDAGVTPNQITYAAVISACTLVRAENTAITYFDEMVKADQVGTSAIHSLMKFYVRKKNADKALECFSLCEKYKLVPTKHIFKSLIDLYVQSDMDRAYQVLREMKEKEVQPEAAHYAVLINAYGNRQRDLSSALNVYSEMILAGVEPDDNLYQVMANVYSKNGEYSKAQEFRFKIVKE